MVERALNAPYFCGEPCLDAPDGTPLPPPARGGSTRRSPSSLRLARRPRGFPRELDDWRLGVEPLDLEAGDALVVGGDVFQLLQREHVGDDVVAVGRALFDHLHDLLRPVA